MKISITYKDYGNNSTATEYSRLASYCKFFTFWGVILCLASGRKIVGLICLVIGLGLYVY